jgi:hypothetical protein
VSAEIISLAEALRELIRTRDALLAEQMQTVHDVRCRQDITRAGYKATDAAVLKDSWEKLYAAIRERQVRLCGVPASATSPIDIDAINQRDGSVDLWKGELWRDGERIFTHVHCLKADVSRLAVPTNAPKKGRRPHDWTAIEQAIHSLMDREGEFDSGNPEWNCRARLEEAICDMFDIGKTQLQGRLPEMLNRWRTRSPGK